MAREKRTVMKVTPKNAVINEEKMAINKSAIRCVRGTEAPAVHAGSESRIVPIGFRAGSESVKRPTESPGISRPCHSLPANLSLTPAIFPSISSSHIFLPRRVAVSRGFLAL
jgi:hypothetical protein